MSDEKQILNVHTQDRFQRPGTFPHQPTVDAKAAEEIKRYFREKVPVMLDGALPKSGDRHNFIRHAQESLAKGPGHADLLPTAVLRETLDAVAGMRRKNDVGRKYDPATKAGITPVGPKTGRVWWDKSVVDNLDDILSHLDKPKAVLRFYDVTGLDPESGRWHDSFDIDVELAEEGRTVGFWAADRAYVVDLGFIHADGRFLRLARTNAVRLPRDCPGASDDSAPVKTLLHPKQRRVSPEIVPDEAAALWAAARPDFETRDLETELVVHMIYRSFLREGPRALRRSPRLFRRDPEVLRREFAVRQHERERAAIRVSSQKPRSGAFLVARLDAERPAPARPIRPAFAPAPARAGVLEAARTALGFTGDGESAGAASRLAWFQGLFAAHRLVVTTGSLPVVRTLPAETVSQPVVRVETEAEPDDLVTSVIGRARSSASFMSSSQSVFQAAQGLRDSLGDFSSSSSSSSSFEDDVDADDPVDDDHQEGIPARIFGGAEAKRMAKAGVRITRMALTLEGRMRPGARLKVAGKLVRADADGNFRLECVLTGRRASIPMRAAPSIGGEARSLINIDWEKRAPREKKKVW